ncbi:hypothetical protein ACKKBG_A22615 [Auxenochlorella protothecoides x Auxenochlorella symbiontica]
MSHREKRGRIDPQVPGSGQVEAIVVFHRGACGMLPGASIAELAESAEPTQVLTSILFTASAAALTIVTLGVAYLSIATWLDQRAEEQDRKGRPIGSGSMSASASAEKKAPRKSPSTAATAKGFGRRSPTERTAGGSKD